MLLCAAATAAAQEKYPNRPVKFVVSFAAGGSNDIVARVLCDWLSEHFGQHFIVENRPGGERHVGAKAVINATPDGYTVHVRRAEQRHRPTLFKNLPFDFLRDTRRSAASCGSPTSWWCRPRFR